jgi:hypothetical protein
VISKRKGYCGKKRLKENFTKNSHVKWEKEKKKVNFNENMSSYVDNQQCWKVKDYYSSKKFACWIALNNNIDAGKKSLKGNSKKRTWEGKKKIFQHIFNNQNHHHPYPCHSMNTDGHKNKLLELMNKKMRKNVVN